MVWLAEYLGGLCIFRLVERRLGGIVCVPVQLGRGHAYQLGVLLPLRLCRGLFKRLWSGCRGAMPPVFVPGASA